MAREYRSKMGYLPKDQITDRINQGLLDKYDYVFCTDTQELVIISDTHEICPVKARFDTYATESEANIQINKKSDTYNGQIVMIFDTTDGWKPYVVNTNENNKFYVIAVTAGHSHAIVDYNLALNIPIINITATNEILLKDLDNGYYKVEGAYRFSEDDPTHRIATNKILFAIEHEIDENSNDICYITEFGAYRIRFYTIAPGYFNPDKYVLQSELEAIMAQYLDDNLDGYVDEYVNDNTATDSDINDLFPNN